MQAKTNTYTESYGFKKLRNRNRNEKLRLRSPVGDRNTVTAKRNPEGIPILTPGQSEESDQILLVNWFNRTHPELAHKLHHSPNGGYRDKRTGQRLKLMGTKAGFHDLVLFHPVGAHTGLVVEMKLGNGCLSPAQQAWIPTY